MRNDISYYGSAANLSSIYFAQIENESGDLQTITQKS
jgi:hypothetical protein